MGSLTELEYIEQLQLATERLLVGDINHDQFEEHCISACVRYRGPPPDGRRYVVGVVEDRVVVGHVASDGPVCYRLRWAAKPPPAEPPHPNAVWSWIDGLWIENDDSLRNRIKNVRSGHGKKMDGRNSCLGKTK